MLVAILISVLFLGGTIFFGYKYMTLKKLTKEFQEIGTGRYGFYEMRVGSYDAYVYVNEIDRYTDGHSKIKLHKVEAISSTYRENSIGYAKDKFISLKLTSEINWLESEDHIKKLRKEKLDKINKI